jgi:hypothetical protein
MIARAARPLSCCTDGARNAQPNEMTRDDISRHLVDLETELHKGEVRRNLHRLAELLHPDFLEIGRSGRRYSREEILAEFGGGGAPARIHAQISRWLSWPMERHS